MSQWYEFKDGQYPREGEIIAVKGEKIGIYPYLLKVEGATRFCRLNDECTKLDFFGMTHWKLIESPY